jgi:lysophospholipase L1-like esterase
MRWLAVMSAALCWSCAATHVDEREARAPGAWEKQISAFEEQDRAQAPSKGGTLFVGSSTIVGWDLDRFFPGLDALNRGFGGSEYADSLHYADRIILPYRPSTVVLYAGDNDIANGKSPERVFADLEALVRKVHRHLPGTRIVVLSIKPSTARWSLWDSMKRTNARMEAFARREPRVAYVDIASALLGPDGKPRAEFFQDDGLHLNAEGYEACSALLRPILGSKGASNGATAGAVIG